MGNELGVLDEGAGLFDSHNEGARRTTIRSAFLAELCEVVLEAALQRCNGSVQSDGAAGLRVVSSWVAGGEWGGCSVSGLANACVVRKDGVVAELLWSEFGTGAVSGFAPGAEVCSVFGSCTAVGADGVVTVTSDPVRVVPAREFVEVD